MFFVIQVILALTLQATLSFSSNIQKVPKYINVIRSILLREMFLINFLKVTHVLNLKSSTVATDRLHLSFFLPI